MILQGQYGHALEEKMEPFDLKSWVTGGPKIRPGIPSNCRIFQSNWLDIENQIDNWTLNSQIDNILRINIWVKFTRLLEPN